MPHDLTQTARPLAALTHMSSEDAGTCNPPPLLGTAEHSSSRNGGGLHPTQETTASSTLPSDNSREGQVVSRAKPRAVVETQGAMTAVSPDVNKYRLCPGFRATLAPVGGTNGVYSFREVMLLLKRYLFSKVHLFDPIDRLYVNCESDPLGQALGVKRFHYKEVTSLVSRNIIKVQPVAGHTSLCGSPPVHEYPSSSSSSNCSSLCIGRSNDSTCGLLVPSGAAACKPESGTVTPQEAQHGLESVAPHSPVPGPSRVCGRERALPGPSCPPPIITCPFIPDSCSDAETIYSVQGYETEFCRNTEFDSEEDDLMEVNSETFEEYELASDDAREEVEHYSDCDSTIDDVEIAVMAYTLVQDDAEEGFWADDDSDTDESSDEEDNDPECVSDRWDCLTCGLKNKPFVRYCGKCWQLRKNWLPDRPKRRRRKPRPKKRNRRKGMASIPPEEQPSSRNTHSLEDQKAGHLSESSDDDTQTEKLARTSSSSTTDSLRSNTQDSGFISSQDLLDSQKLLENSEDNGAEERTVVPPSVSSEATQAEQALEDAVQPKMSSSSSSSSNRKRKYSSTGDVSPSKCSKVVEEGEAEVPFGDQEILVNGMPLSQFFSTSAGRTYLNSPAGLKCSRYFQASPAMQESLRKDLAENTSPGAVSGFSVLCSICCLRPKNAVIIHGRLAHQATCYQCARRLHNSGEKCPVCRRKIHMVCKHIIS